MILSDIQAECYARLGWGSSPESDVVDRILKFINSAVKETLTEPGIASKFIHRPDMPCVTVADSAYLALPQAATFLKHLVDRTNDRELMEVSVGWIRRQDPGRTFSSSTPTHYAIHSYSSPVYAQPESQGQLTAVSSSASDTTPVVRGEVVVANGYVRTLTDVTLTGTVAVNVGPTDTLQVNDLYLSAAPAGEVTVLDDDGNTITRIGIGRTRARYTLLELYPVPSSVLTLYGDVELAILPLANATDEPLLPDDYFEVIVDRVRRREYEKRERIDLADKAEARAGRRLGTLKLKAAVKSHVNENQEFRFSHLGPYFPSGS